MRAKISCVACDSRWRWAGELIIGVDRAVASSKILDILKAAGLTSPDFSILSAEFLLEIGSMEKKNLTIETLKKLLNGEIRSRSKTNLVESRPFRNGWTMRLPAIMPMRFRRSKCSMN